jgi:hypothetical protein
MGVFKTADQAQTWRLLELQVGSNLKGDHDHVMYRFEAWRIPYWPLYCFAGGTITSAMDYYEQS